MVSTSIRSVAVSMKIRAQGALSEKLDALELSGSILNHLPIPALLKGGALTISCRRRRYAVAVSEDGKHIISVIMKSRLVYHKMKRGPEITSEWCTCIYHAAFPEAQVSDWGQAIGEMRIGRASLRPKITRDVYLHRPDLREMWSLERMRCW
jgi:hypothetical protein